tara:strand:+ start:203 stop:364 length:162 start_codon:yes stop_codon:yes gene_type:complete
LAQNNNFARFVIILLDFDSILKLETVALQACLLDFGAVDFAPFLRQKCALPTA